MYRRTCEGQRLPADSSWRRSHCGLRTALCFRLAMVGEARQREFRGAGYVKYQVDGNEALAQLPNLKGELHRPAHREAIRPRRTRIAEEYGWHRAAGAPVKSGRASWRER